MGSGKGINVRTFDKHLKWLVSERVLERIEETRYKVYYRPTIPAKLKVYAEASREHTVSIVNNIEKSSAARPQIPESVVELLMDWIGYSVKGALLMGILLWIGDNHVWARYWVDEEMETTRYVFNKMVAIFEKKENIKNLYQLVDRLDHKWGEQCKRDIEAARDFIPV
jgi:hypothetical protein